MKKGEIYEGTVDTVLFPNKGIIETEGTRAVVKNTIPGQKVRFRVTKKKSGHAEGRLLEVLSPSPLETEDPGCGIFPACGGCQYRTLKYEDQLRLKEDQLLGLLRPVLGDELDRIYAGMLESPLAEGYRNKMEYTFGDSEKDGPITLGLHRRGSMYDVLTADHCRLVHDDFNKIVACVQDWARESGLPYYHKRTHEGYFRHLLVRRASASGEILAAVVTATAAGVTAAATGEGIMSTNESGLFSDLCTRLLALDLEGKLTGIMHIYNDSVADTVRCDSSELLYGNDCFYEEIMGLRFKITPFSFFQTNSKGAEVLYGAARGFLGDVDDKVVFDLYSGTGTIAQMLAPVARKAVGIEIVPEAVMAAGENAAINGLGNCEFICGDVLRVVDDLDGRPDVIVLDPPRDGVHPKALPKILRFGADKIIYISCKPSSLARDLPVILGSGYTAEKLCAVDMFPFAGHVETVVLMTRG